MTEKGGEMNKIVFAFLFISIISLLNRALPKAYRLMLLEKANFLCVRCGVGGRSSNIKLEIDHITPVSMGGGDEESNLQVLCVMCHDIKHFGYYTGRKKTFG